MVPIILVFLSVQKTLYISILPNTGSTYCKLILIQVVVVVSIIYLNFSVLYSFANTHSNGLTTMAKNSVPHSDDTSNPYGTFLVRTVLWILLAGSMMGFANNFVEKENPMLWVYLAFGLSLVSIIILIINKFVFKSKVSQDDFKSLLKGKAVYVPFLICLGMYLAKRTNQVDAGVALLAMISILSGMDRWKSK